MERSLILHKTVGPEFAGRTGVRDAHDSHDAGG